MGTKKVEQGKTGERVRINIATLRKARGYTGAELSERTARLGRAISATGINKIELGHRRVDVDDLVTLAHALEVTPTLLLGPVSIIVTIRTGDGRHVTTEALNCEEEAP